MTIGKVLNRRVLVGATVAGLVVTGASGVATAAPGSAPPPAPPAPPQARGLPATAHGGAHARISTPGTPRVLGGSGPAGVPSKGKYAFLIELSQGSTAHAYRGAAARGKAAASSAAKAQYSRIKTQQAGVESKLPKGTSVLYRTHSALAGIGVYTDARNLDALRGISGVQAVYPIAPKTMSNANAVPFQGGAAAWTAHGNLGDGSTIAIIDSGIDYTHADFGGPGTAAAYNTAKANEANAADPAQFPNAKVVGGIDLVGDAYNPDDPNHATAQPDPNPLDCNGHGSHVAGTAAGYGENADGTTYTGAYNNSTPFSSMKIGPGMAPMAKLYAIKVFGCDGPTNFVADAIDKAMDPNGDGDTSDHVNVINMSLGADFGSPQDGDSVAANQAADAGITVAVASGNGGDYYDVGGSPGDAVKAIAVANSVDAVDLLDTLHVSAPAATYAGERSVEYDWANDSDLAGQVVAISDSTNKDGCAPISQSGVAGKIVFLDWTENDAQRRCGSGQRADNAHAAGASGFIFGSDSNFFSAGISGSADLPGVMVVKSAADAIRARLATGPVTVSGTSANDFKLDHAGNDDLVNAGSSRGVRGAGNVKPDVTAVGTGVFSTAVGTGTGGVSESGTSMATPMVAGLAALVHSAHPAWTSEQVKADIMNTAGQDLYTGENHTGAKYGPNRVGAGRIEADAALANNVLAYVQDNPGAVSVSFGPIAVTKAYSVGKTVKVQNTGPTSVTYSLSYHAATTVPGVSYVLSPSSITVPAGQTATFTVTLSIPNPKALTKTIDPTMDPTQFGYARDYVADASGQVQLTATSGTAVPLRVPVYSAPRPASVMSEASSLAMPDTVVQKSSLRLSGQGVAQGEYGTDGILSAVSGFELQANSGLAPTCSTAVTTLCVPEGVADARSADIKHVGASSDAPLVVALQAGTAFDGTAYFAVNTQGPWRTPASTQEFDIVMDTTGDGAPDVVLYNVAYGDTFWAELADWNTGAVIADNPIDDRLGNQDAALFDSDTMIMPARISDLPGITSRHTRITYGVVSFSSEAGAVDSIGFDLTTLRLKQPLTFDPIMPGLIVYGAYGRGYSLIRFSDQPDTVVTVRRDTRSYYLDHALGAMLVHFNNKVGVKSKVTSLMTTPKITIKLSRSSAPLGTKVSASITVLSEGVTASGKVNLRHVGGGVFATGTLRSGKVTLSLAPKARGKVVVRAEYAGDGNYRAGNSANVTLTVT